MSRPTNFAPPPSLFLPLAEDVVSGLASDEDVSGFFASASIHELSVVLLLQNLPALVRKGVSVSKIETLFDGVIKAGLAPIDKGDPSFSAQVFERFDPVALAAGARECLMLGISFLEQDDIAEQEYLMGNGTWDFTFARRHINRLQPKRDIILPTGTRVRLGDQQGRLFDEFRSGLDESFHLQGYAGTGKTFLISKFIELLNPATTLLMAYLPSQLVALKARVQLSGNPQLNAYTFGHMANLILNRDRTSQPWVLTDTQRAMPNYLVTDQQMAKWLKLQAVSALRPREVANLCRRTVFSYCISSSAEIEARHLPAAGCKLSELDIAVLLDYARRMWQETIAPSSPEIRFPVRNVHRIKYLALGSGIFPPEYTHIIIDESHELSEPMLQILDRSPQAVLTLGDDYQHLNGMASRHGNLVRQRNVTQSLRAGKQMEGVLNPFIQLHPGSVKDEYLGRAGYPTVIMPYDDAMPIPGKPTTIIVAGEWGMLNWFKKLIDVGADFHIPASALKELATFVAGLVQLHGHGVRPSHRILFRYSSWDELATAMGGNHGFLAAQLLLDRGFTMEEFNRYTADYCADVGAAITLARVDDVKNQEFDSVLLSRDLMRPPNAGTAHSMARVCSMIYTSASRARHELLIPGNLSDWAQDISRPQAPY